jgi:hypothetical protein
LIPLSARRGLEIVTSGPRDRPRRKQNDTQRNYPRPDLSPQPQSVYVDQDARGYASDVSLLARRGAPMSVGQIVAAVDVGQPTVSAHLKTLAEVRFVLAHHRGTATCYRINQACVRCFPTAADLEMGKPASAAQGGVTNARFLLGRVEQIPLPGGHVDVIISNCVINLAADKARVPAEA